MAFTHLHLHTEYSLLDGACRIDRLMEKLSALGQTSAAITDHGVMYGVIDFYRAAKKHGIKPIIGCEVYVAQRTRHDRVFDLDRENRHLVLLCENETGYRNLMALVSAAWTEGFYNRPRVDFELLERYHEGLIALSACMAGEIPRALARMDYAGAREAALRYDRIFGHGNFYLEVQDHGIPQQKEINQGLLRLSKELDIPLVATNDCHYINKEDHEMHNVLLCIQTGRTVNDENGMGFETEEFYVKSEEKMRALFAAFPRAIENTAKIAERCNVEIEFGVTRLPRFTPPDGTDSETYFRRLCYEGLTRRYGDDPDPQIKERLEYELDVISRMGFTNYFLIVWDFIRYARSVDIPVGPGRGSGAGSLAAYCVGITNVDPIRYSLIFERFLNEERVSMPDFDIDFSDERRDEIIRYVEEKYGADHVAQIVTFGTLAAKQAIRDVGRAYGIPLSKVDQVAKLVPGGPGVSLEAVFSSSRDLREMMDDDSQVKKLIEMALQLEGTPRHASTHAAGVLITDKPLTDYVPLAKNGEIVVSQYSHLLVADLGLLKMDFLGLRNLSVIANAQKLIREHTPDFNIEAVPDDDPATFKMLAAGETVGVFQLESAGMRRLTMQAQSRSIEDITAVIALYRPGPMQFIPQYLENKQVPGKTVYLHEKLRPILEVTSGCIIYQEQVMQIFRELAGYSLGRADIVRRAMAKKHRDELELERQIFLYGQQNDDGTWEVEGCLNRGIPEETAKALFAQIESFASYAFNKAHAAAYAVVAYETAYLKCHYPKEYMAALLSSVSGWTDKAVEYMEECHRLQIAVLPPHVNHSGPGFQVAGEGIRYGLLVVKNLGRGLIRQIVTEREQNGPYTSFTNFCRRLAGKELNRLALDSLILCGALDHLGNNRREMIAAADDVLTSLEEGRRRNLEGQLGFFDSGSIPQEDPPLAPMEEYPAFELLTREKEVTGMYLSGHPMMGYAQLYRTGQYARTDEIAASHRGDGRQYADGQRARLLALVAGVKEKTTKKGDRMAFLTLEDMYGGITGLVFPKIFSDNRAQLKEGAVLEVSGRLSFSEDKEPELLCDGFAPAPTDAPAAAQEASSAPKKSSRPGLYLRVESKADPACEKALQFVRIFDEGRNDLYLYYKDEKQLVRAPARYRCDVNPVLIRELKRILGGENVAFVE